MNHRFPGLLILFVAGLAGAAEVNWPAFMARHDMTWDSMPKNWTQAPHFGNGRIGSMLYEGDGALRLHVFHAGVHDHRDNTHGWTAYSRAKYNIGDFYLKPVGRITGCELTKNIWNAELTGTVTTDVGRIAIRHLVHREDIIIVTEIVPSEGETGCEWSWKPVQAVEHAAEVEMPEWFERHRRWWHRYYRQSYVSLPDRSIESLYWQTIYPLLRRSINMYRHMLQKEGGTLRLQPTYSPETGTFKDCNFDLGLLKWGCKMLLEAADRLEVDDPLIPVWKDILARGVEYPVDEYGFRLGADKTSPTNHRHGSHFIAAYPLYMVNIEQDGTEELLAATLKRFRKAPGYPGMRVAYSGPLAAALGYGDIALEELKDLEGDLHPNGLWFRSPCLEISLSAANVVQEMLIQSWGDKIRVFPAMPAEWADAEFHDLRTEGAFLVSAKRVGGITQWVKVKSLAGEPY